MTRVLVIGCGAVGKTTFAQRLAATTGLPLIHLDSLYWKAGWIKTPDPEWEPVVREAIAHEQWIIDGSYTGTLALRLTRADTVIYLDYPRRISYWHMVKRRIRYALPGSRRPGLPEGCPERIFGSFVKWIWRYPKRDRPRVLSIIQNAAHVDVVRLESPKKADAYLKQFS